VTTDGTRLRVVSYNIQSLRGEEASLAGVVRELAPHVLVVQEGLSWANPLTWCANLARRFGLAHAVGGLPGLGNVVFAAAGVIVRERWIVRYPLAFGHHPRGAVFARCSFGSAAFVVAGSHLSTDAGTRLLQARLLKDGISKAAVSTPVVLGVDVNETPAGPAWRTLAEGLVDAAEATGKEDVPTFPASAPVRRLDAIFLDPRWSVLDYRVLDTERAIVASDHLPVLADVALRSVRDQISPRPARPAA
jgi:endonuclease/exonuclease/phosphatase family metal-dependent hydrolase